MDVQRRDFLKRSLAITATAAFSPRVIADTLSNSTLPHPGLPHLNQLTGHIILRGDKDYEDARMGRNTSVASFPAVIVFCRTTQDVVRAVNWAREQHVPLRIRSGRHSYEGYSSVDDGIVIDIRDLRRVRYNASQGTVKVGAGMSLAKLYEALWQHKVTVPGGSCPTVGVAGHALGGGHGLLSRQFGLACDSVQEVEVVTAAGKIIRANSHTHPDLLWASRGGGGGNFGVVTSFVFKVHPIDKVSIYYLSWKWNDLEAVLHAWQSWAPTVDNRLSSILVLKPFSNGTLSSIGQFVGSEEELRSVLAPLTNAGSPVDFSVETMSFMDAMQIFSGQTPDRNRWHLHWTAENNHFKNSSAYADKPLGDDAIKTLRHALETAPGSACLIQFEAYGGAINHLAPDATAFVHRAGTLFNLQYQAYWGKDQDKAPYVAWIEDLRHAMNLFVSGRAYSNYCDSQIENWPQAYYGENLSRLSKIKKKYDPHDLFHFPQSIPVI